MRNSDSNVHNCFKTVGDSVWIRRKYIQPFNIHTKVICFRFLAQMPNIRSIYTTERVEMHSQISRGATSLSAKIQSKFVDLNVNTSASSRSHFISHFVLMFVFTAAYARISIDSPNTRAKRMLTRNSYTAIRHRALRTAFARIDLKCVAWTTAPTSLFVMMMMTIITMLIIIVIAVIIIAAMPVTSISICVDSRHTHTHTLKLICAGIKPWAYWRNIFRWTNKNCVYLSQSQIKARENAD